MTSKKISPAVRSLIAAARAARKHVVQTRTAIIQGHSKPAFSSKVKHVEDPHALAWIGEHDALIAKIDKAVAKALAEAA